MKIAEMKPNTVYRSDRSSYRNPEFFITGDPLFEVETIQKHSWHKPTFRKVVYGCGLSNFSGEGPTIGPRQAIVLAQVAHEVGTMDDYRVLMDRLTANRDHQVLHNEWGQGSVKALAEALKAVNVSTYPGPGYTKLVISGPEALQGLAQLLGIELEPYPTRPEV